MKSILFLGSITFNENNKKSLTVETSNSLGTVYHIIIILNEYFTQDNGKLILRLHLVNLYNKDTSEEGIKN